MISHLVLAAYVGWLPTSLATSQLEKTPTLRIDSEVGRPELLLPQ